MVDGRHSTRRAVREGRASLVSKAEADSATLGQCSKRARTQRTRKASDAAAQPKRKRDQADNASPAKKLKKPNPVSSPKKANKVSVARKPAEEQAPVLQKPQAQPAQAHDADSPEQIEIEYKWIQGELNRLSKHPRTGSYQDQLTVLFASEAWVRQAAREAREEEEAYRESLEQRPPPPPLITSSEAEIECGNDRLDGKDAAKSLHEPSAVARSPGPDFQSCGTKLAISPPPGDTASSSGQVPVAPVLDVSPDLPTAAPAPDASLPVPSTAAPMHAPEAPVLRTAVPACAVESPDATTAVPGPAPKATEPDAAVPAPAPKPIDPATAVPGHTSDPAPRAPTASRVEPEHSTAPPPSTTVPSPTYSAVPPDNEHSSPPDNEHSSPPAEDPLQPATATAPPEFEDPGTDVGEDFSSLFGGEGETPPIPAAAEEKPAPLALPKPIPEPAHTSEELASPVRFVGSLPGLNLDLSRFPTLNPVKGTGKIFMPKVDKRADTDTAGP